METLETSDLIKILAVIVLGATGTYLLLPHRHGLTRPKAGASRSASASATLAVLAFTLLLEAPTGWSLVSKFFFYLFAFSAVGGGDPDGHQPRPDPQRPLVRLGDPLDLGPVPALGPSPVRLGRARTVIVYAGAIIVTFLFVLMLAQKEGRAVYDRMARSPFWATFASFLLLFGLIYLLAGGPEGPPGSATIASRERWPSAAKSLGQALRQPPGPGRRTARPAPPDHARAGTGPRPGPARRPRCCPRPSPTARGVRQSARQLPGLGRQRSNTEHLVTVELAGALLFVALIGALAIATPKAPIRPSTSDAAPKA